MAGLLSATPGPGFVGHHSIYQFENADGTNPGTACGQCAIATVLANYRRIPKSIAGLRTIEKNYPADILGGAAGTSPNLVRRALRSYDLYYRNISGREELEQALGNRRAAIVLIQNSAGLGGMGAGAHWFVVFACDKNGVHATNYYNPPLIDWATFEWMWSSPISTVAGMGERVICC